jgi:hypothetical protein
MSDAVTLTVDQAVIKPVVELVMAEVLDRLGQLPADRLAFTEVEAAGLLGIPSYVLRDCLRRGEVAARKVGKGYLYARSALLELLATKAEPKGRRRGK